MTRPNADVDIKRDVKVTCLTSIFNWACYHGKTTILKKTAEMLAEHGVSLTTGTMCIPIHARTHRQSDSQSKT